MIAEIAGKIVSKFIDKSWPSDKEEVYEILKLGINKAWQEGKWLGMTAEFHVPVQVDSEGQHYIIAPQSHPIMLAANSNGKNVSLRDKYFLFHRNGMGEIKNTKDCQWNQDIYDISSSPVINENNINFADGVTIGVRAIGPAGPNEKVYINGTHEDGSRIFTYAKNTYGSPCGCNINKDEIDTVNGVSLDISQKFNYICNVKFHDIKSITKTQTRTPIEIIAIDSLNNGHVISRMMPNQRFSKYRKYLVPKQLCGRKTIHGLFKISQQEEITSATDELIISNEEALICFAKGIHLMYYKEQMEAGAGYILQGISVLEKERREEESPTEFPIQVDGIYYEDHPEVMKYHS